MEVDDEVVLRLLTGLRECARHVTRGVAEHPLDETDVGLLAMAQAAHGELRPSRAADALGVAFPSVTRHVRALQGAGHLAVVPDPDDGRSYRIELTAAGAAMLRDFRAGLVSRFEPVLRDWSGAEVASLADGLTRLAGAMTRARQEEGARPGRSSWWRTMSKGRQR